MGSSIGRVAVLGSGVMGSGIAAHLANAGVPSLLFDIVPLPRTGGAPGASQTPPVDAKDRRQLAKAGIASALKAKPAAFFRPENDALIEACNFEDDAARLGQCDWIVEAVTERLDIKQKVFELVATHRRPGSIVSSNTSGIPLAAMVPTMPDEMRQHFLITHFFNPVRYMRLLEIVAGPDTDPAVVSTMVSFGEDVLGKGIVYAKDTPNFVANRIGTFGMASVFKHMVELGLSVEAVDAILGKPMGRPASAVFRTANLVGIDTLVHVFGGTYERAPQDEQRDAFVVPEFVAALVKSGRIGEKAGAGFYKKTKVDGETQILSLDLKTGEYKPQEKVRFDSLGKARNAEGTVDSVKAILAGSDAASKLAWAVTADTLIYSANRIPEIADDVVQVDRAMRWGFGWDLGPFETWDAIGVRKTVERMKAEGRAVPAWVDAMLAAGQESFYARDAQGSPTFWKGRVEAVPQAAGRILLADVTARGKVVHRSATASLLDLGDGVLCLEAHGKMNAIDELVIAEYESALDKLDSGEFDALVIGNQSPTAFCAGANLMMIMGGAMQKQWDLLDASIARLQRLMMRGKYSKKPVVTAPFQLTLGGGMEIAMHSSATRAGGELYMGQVEVGVGLIPAAGGCKELLCRYLGEAPQDVDYDPNPYVQKAFERIALAKVSSSAEEARAWGFLRPGDGITLDPDKLIADAKNVALGLIRAGYQPPRQRTVKLPGPQGRAAIELFLYQMHEGGFATDHDVTVGKKLARVLTGGDIPPNTAVTEQKLLDLEREAFLSLCGDQKTIDRIQNMLMKGKPLRN